MPAEEDVEEVEEEEEEEGIESDLLVKIKYNSK
jgi:hypothetical protein